jgi:hypothetical protein
MIEHNDERLVGRRYLSARPDEEEVPALKAASPAKAPTDDLLHHALGLDCAAVAVALHS